MLDKDAADIDIKPRQGFYDHGVKTLQQQGMKLTAQRLAILDAFSSSFEHHTPQEIFGLLEDSVPSMSLATVYNTLELFEKLDIITRVCTEEGQAYFDPNVQPHHHAVCNRCGKIFDVFVAEDTLQALISTTQPSPHAAQDFSVEQATVWFRGVCADCA